MKVFDMKTNINDDELKTAASAIRNGELVIFPTETVYGIGANGLDSKAVDDIYTAKGRGNDNPLIFHISDKKMIYDLASKVSDVEELLVNEFFPGPLTIIFDKKECVPNRATGNLDTVGIRMPNNEIANKLISYSNVPIAAPSANISGRPSGTNVNDIIDELGPKVSYIIDGGDSVIGVESTVIRVIDDVIHILRPGYITKEMLEVYAPVIIDKHVLEEVSSGEKVMSPGMKYKHYAPNTKCIMVYGNESLMIDKIKELETNNTLVICNEKNVSKFKKSISYGSTLNEIAHNIFRILREVDKYNADLVIIEGVEKKGIGLAIMNRLIRSCSHNYIEIK